MKKLNGVHVPHNKNTASNLPEVMPVPPEIVLPMSMHLGAPAKPIVAKGDSVTVGQVIGEAQGAVSSPVHSGVSGTVKNVGEIDGAGGQKVLAVTIETDGQQTELVGLTPPIITNRAEFIAAVRDSGAVGLGGAGFPTAVKLNVPEGKLLDYIIINGAECEPFITSDTIAMTLEADYVWEGIMLLKKFLNPGKVIVGIEDNKPKPIKIFQERAKSDSGVEVHSLPALYPQGGEKVLIYNTTGRIVPEGGLPLDIGVVVINCATVAFIAKYIKTGMPLVTKCVTVDGGAVKKPQNVIVPIGTPVRALLEFCGGLNGEPYKLLFGGPMMGVAVPNADFPVMKNTNAVLALTEKEAKLPDETACIRCGRCVAACPMRLMPLNIESAYRLKKPDLIEHYKVNLCMECGCCAFSCPAKRHLVQVMKLSKGALRDYQNSKKTGGSGK